MAYSSKHTLSGHVREKHPVYYLCTYCEKMFQSTTKLRIHYSHQHEVNALSKEFYICWKCKKSCSSFNDLDDHLGKNLNTGWLSQIWINSIKCILDKFVQI